MSFSLRWLFIAVFLIALSMVALLYANVWWAGTARAAMFFILPLGAVIAIISAGTTRIFWLGFVIVGSVQFWSMGFAKWNSEVYLLWDSVINWAHPKILRDVTVQMPAPGHEVLSGETVPYTVRMPSKEDFRIVAYCISSAVLGVVGGFVAVWFYSRREPRPAKPKRIEGGVTDHT